MPPIINANELDSTELALLTRLTSFEIRRKEKLEFIEIMGDDR
jgi:hypothetical protein